jgi:hypothetical protein
MASSRGLGNSANGWAVLRRAPSSKSKGELRYPEFHPNGSDAKVRTAEIHAISILTLDRAEKTEHEGETAAAESPGEDDLPALLGYGDLKTGLPPRCEMFGARPSQIVVIFSARCQN